MLSLNHVVKTYGKKSALKGVSLEFGEGVYALLGPNGAGKSTLMNIITDNMKYDEGVISYYGTDIKKLGRNYRKVIGFAPQQQGLYDEFTGRRFLLYMAALKKLPKGNWTEEINRVAEAVNLLDQLDKKLGAYSGGMKQRILVAQAMLGSPKILILDEPTAGLDPKERIRIRELLAEQGKEKLILIATHIVSDIQSIAKEIILLKDGVVVEHGTNEELIQKYESANDLEDVYMELFHGGGEE